MLYIHSFKYENQKEAVAEQNPRKTQRHRHRALLPQGGTETRSSRGQTRKAYAQRASSAASH